jgi:predicted CXXCH cytochrome family protein
VPDYLPLDDSARITCLTCHVESDSSAVAATDGDDNERMLRIPDGADLCGSCHLQSDVMGKNRQHWQFSTRAHLRRMNPEPKTIANPVRFFGDIDAESYACLGCHEEVTATIPGYNETRAQKAARRSRMKDHPIGMNYKSSSMAKAGRLRSLEHADSAIRLFDGKVGCGSCHSLYSGAKSYLAKENHRSSLCFQCHAR